MLVMGLICTGCLILMFLWYITPNKHIFEAIDVLKFFFTEAFKMPINCTYKGDCIKDLKDCVSCEHNGRNVPRGTLKKYNYAVTYVFLDEKTNKFMCDSVRIEAFNRAHAETLFNDIEQEKIEKSKGITVLKINQINLY